MWEYVWLVLIGDAESSEPESDVIVCCTLSSFVQVTVSPVFIVIVAGSKAKFEIVMASVFAPDDEAGAELEGVWDDDEGDAGGYAP